MVLDLFKNLSDEGKLIVIESGVPLREQLLNVDWSEMVILANGKKVSPDYEPQEEDYLVIRRLHGSTAVVAWIAIAVAVIGGIAAGIASYNARKQQKKMKELQEQLSARDDVSNIPWLQGAANSVATGKSQPYIIGEHLFTPYLLQKGFYKISGTDGINQDYYTVLEGGFSSQAIKKISAEDTLIHNFGNQTTPQTGQTRPTGGIWQYRSGVNDNLIQIGQAGSGITLDEFKYKRAVDEPNVQLPWRDVCETWTAYKEEEYTEKVWHEGHGDDNGYWRNEKRTRTVSYQAGEVKTETVKFTLDKHAMNVEICLMFNGLCVYSDKGKKQNHTRNIGFRYSTNGGSSWSALTMSGTGPTSTSTSGGYFICTFTRSSTTQLRFNLTHTFTASQGWNAGNNNQPIIVEVTNRDVASTAKGGAYEDCYVQQVMSKIYDPETSSSSSLSACKVLEDRENNVSTVIGLKLRASAENEDKLGKINIITSGVARTWNGSTWSSTKTATRNPAAWILEVLTSSTHPASKFDDSEIDLPSLGALYSFCSTNGFNIDMVLTAGQKKDTILEAICNVCRCMLYRNIYGKISVAIDRVKENAVALLNAQNIRDIEITKSMGRQVDGLKLSWVNAAAGYVQDEYVCMRAGVTRTADSIIREMDVQGITNYDHLVKYARYIMAGERLRPKAIKVTTGLEGVYYTPFSKLLMQDDSLRVGLGNAVIKSVVTSGGNIIALQLEEAVDLDTTHDFGVIVQCVSDDYCTPLALAINQGGRTDEIALSSPISASASVIPHAGDILSYGYIEDGEFDKITSEYLITGIEPKSDGVTLSLIDYDPDVYTTGAYGEYKPNITQKPEPYVPVIIPPQQTQADMDDVLNGDNIAPPDTPTGVTAVATERGLVVTVSPPDNQYLNNSIAKIVWEYSPDGIVPEGSTTDEPTFTAWEPVTTFEATMPWSGYPEASDLYTWLVRVKFVSIYGKESEYSTYVTVNTDTYGTWLVQNPVMVLRTNKRSLHLNMTQPPSAKVYGNVRYQVQISRYDDVEDETRLWYQPNLSADPYGAEDAYKGTEGGYVVATNDFSITVPLEGQTDTPPAPSDTVYYFRITPFNEAGTGSAIVTDQMTARATGARDVVLAHMGDGSMNTDALTAQNIYVENLASIVGMFAQIRDGAETADNFWDLENSEFRVGNDHTLEGETIDQDDTGAQYIHFKDGDLKMHITKLIADISQSYVKGIFDIYSSDQLYRCRVSEQGLTLQSRASLSAAWETKGVFSINPANGSLMITNTAASSDYTTTKPSGAKVYHFQESAGTNPLDDNGANGEGLTFGSYSYEDSSPILVSQVQYYQGTLSKANIATKSAVTYGTPAFRAADNVGWGSASGFMAARSTVDASTKTITLYVLNTLTNTITSATATIEDSSFTSFGHRYTFWYKGQPFVGVIYNRSGTPASKLIVFNSAGQPIWQPTQQFNYFTVLDGIVYAQYATGGSKTYRLGVYTPGSSSATVSVKQFTNRPTDIIFTYGEPYFFIRSTTTGAQWLQAIGVKTFEERVKITDAISAPTHHYGAGQNEWVRYQDRQIGYTYYAIAYSMNAGINLVDYTMIEGGSVFVGTTQALEYIWCIRKSDNLLGRWSWTSGGSGMFTAVGAATYDASHSWCYTGDMLLDKTNGAAYRLAAYNQTSTQTKNYAFWYNGTEVKFGSFTLATPGEWCYVTLALASGTITWHIYKTDGTSTTGTYALSTYTDSTTASNTGLVLNGSVEEFSYGVLPTGETLSNILTYKVPYGSIDNLPIPDQFIMNAKDPSKVVSNAFWCKNEAIVISGRDENNSSFSFTIGGYVTP